MTITEVKNIARRIAGTIVRFTTTSKSSDTGHDDAVDGRGNDSDAPSLGVRRLWPFGIRSRPPAGCDAVVIHANSGATNGVMVGAESKKYGPGDLKSGETAIYAIKAGCLIKLDEDGGITVTAEPDQSVNIAVTGGGNVNITVDSGAKVYVGATSGTQPIALGTASKSNFDNIKTTLDDIKTHLNTLNTDLSSHTHSGVQAGAGVSGPPSSPFSSTPPTPSAVTDPRAARSETA